MVIVPNSPSASMAPESAVVASALAKARIVGAVEVAAASLFFYDYALTFADEIELVWRRKWGAGKILFLLARYLVLPQLFITLYSALFNSHHTIDCLKGTAYAIWSLLLGVAAADGILVIRTWAIWDTRLSVLVFLSALLCGNTVLSFYLAVDFLHDLHSHQIAQLRPRIAYHICLVSSSNNHIGIFWITIAAFEILVFVMTAIKGLHYLHQRTRGVAKFLYRDGILYFVYIFSISTGNLTLVYRHQPAYMLLLGVMQCSLYSVLCCRLVLHIRASARTPVHLSNLADLSAPPVIDDEDEETGRRASSLA